MEKQKKKMSHTGGLAVGFALLILFGTFLLTLPAATRTGRSMDVLDALFTATSATCVTGLVVADTYQNWSVFGQLVIIMMIQIGGIGFITIGVYIAVILKKKIGLKQREAIHESVNTIQVAGVVRLTKKIIQGTFLVEAIGAVLLSFHFIPEEGLVKGIYYSVFHSISAFCNAGFDLMGKTVPYSSFTAYEDNILINLVLMALVIIGGIGFVVWDDVFRNKWHFKKYLLHTKLVIWTTGVLIAGGTVLFLIFEWNNLFADMTLKEKLLGALFSAVTPRTAGFNTVDTAALSHSSKLLTIILMFIGGSPGSTAGGIKTTTMMVMLLVAISTVKHTMGTNIFGRRLEEDTIKKASTVFIINLFLAVTACLIILGVQDFSMEDVVFEVFSAIGTVGMSTGITRELNAVSKGVIILLMYCGRVGSLTFALTFAERKIAAPVQQPAEKIVVG